MEPEEPERRQMDRERQEQSEQQQEYETFLYKFQQQIIDAWKPVPHTGSNVILYIILCAVCFGLGLGLVLSAPNYPEIEVQYTDCAVGSTCTKTFTLTEALPAPVYFYYGFKGFYQNHRRYLKYFSSTQLDTGTVDAAGVSTDCGDFVTNLQTFGTGATSAGGATLTDANVAFPCGTIARFFKVLEPEIVFATSGSTGTVLTGPAAGPITISATQTGIAWPSDIGRHKNPTDLNQAGIDVTKETWLVWFRPAARSDFFKLNAIINTDLPAGDYTVTFNSVTVDPTFGQKWISISKSNFVGNRDLFLGIAFLALGAGCLMLLVVFLAKWIAEKRDRQKFQ